jgi:hypothetical protein
MHSQVSVNVNIGSPPLWGPSGYSNIDYYYLPDVQAYYDIRPRNLFILGGKLGDQGIYRDDTKTILCMDSGFKRLSRQNTLYTHYKQHKVKLLQGIQGQATKVYRSKTKQQ